MSHINMDNDALHLQNDQANRLPTKPVAMVQLEDSGITDYFLTELYFEVQMLFISPTVYK